MIALYIVLGIALAVFLLLMIRVQIFAAYTDDLHLKIKVLFFQKTILPAPPKHKKKKKQKSKPGKKSDQKPADAKQEKQSYLGKLREKKGLSGVVSLLTEVAKITGGVLKGIFAHMVIHRMNVGIALNSGDAASTAVAYGNLCAVVYPAVNVIAAATVCKDYNVTVEPIFDGDRQTEISVDVYAHLRLFFVIDDAIKAGLRLMWLRLRLLK